MRKKLFSAALALTLVVGASAQVYDDQSSQSIIDAQEDTSQVTTVNDIIAMQQKVSISSGTERHFDNVWSYRKYRNIGYNTSASLNASENITMQTGRTEKPKYKSDWGVSIVLGTNYRLHKPIDNMFSFSFDYTWFDFNVNHFKAEDGATYDSRDMNGDYNYMPWNLEKYELDYGMMVGPSVTVAPFTKTSSQALHYLKAQLYFHFGYRFSSIFVHNDKDADLANQTTSTTTYDEENDMDNAMKGGWGTGFYTKFGFNVSWKFIGLGFEHSGGSIKYKPFNTDTFGKDKTKFDLGMSRVFVQFRF